MFSCNRSCPITTCAATPTTLHATNGNFRDLWKPICVFNLLHCPLILFPRHVVYLRIR